MSDSHRTIGDSTSFDKAGYKGNWYVENKEELGFNALLVTVFGKHPKKRILEGTTRCYFVKKGFGTFTINNVQIDVKENSLLIIKGGDKYEYEGEMELFEFNISPHNLFLDERI